MLSLNFWFLFQMIKPVSTVEHSIDHIEYQASMSSNKYLSSVSFDGINFNFEKNNTNYTIEVPFSKSSLGLHYVLEDEKAQVDVIGDEELLLGNNSLAIIVTAEDGTTLEYDFTIIRKEDNSIIQDDFDSIRAGILGNENNKLTINVTSKDMILDESLTNLLKLSSKTLVFSWTDMRGNFMSSLTIDGREVDEPNSIDVNIKNNISDTKLINLMNNTEYMALSTVNTNIPKKSIYKMKIDAKEDVYYLYYYENDLLITKPLRVIDNTVEFEVENGIDYAVTARKADTSSSSNGVFHWFWISLFITVLFLVFFFITKYTALKFVQNSHHEENNKKSQK